MRAMRGVVLLLGELMPVRDACIIRTGTAVVALTVLSVHLALRIAELAENNGGEAQATLPGPETDKSELPTLYLITPTYARPTQKADITRMCQASRLAFAF